MTLPLTTKQGMFRAAPPEQAAALIACVYAAERAQQRLSESYGEIAEARELAARHRLPLAEAAAIVRRSRR